jgi:hypothetical protein
VCALYKPALAANPRKSADPKDLPSGKFFYFFLTEALRHGEFLKTFRAFRGQKKVKTKNDIDAGPGTWDLRPGTRKTNH